MNLLSSLCVRVVARGSKQFSVLHAGLLVVLLLGLPFLAHAQEATIVGTVTDPSGAVVPNVSITITSVATGATHSFTTNDAGQYVASNLSIGKYDLRAEAAGFRVKEAKDVILNVSDRLRVDFQMEVGAKTESVTIEANAIAVQTDTGEQSSLLNGTQMSELATNGRTLYSYVVLAPGASSLAPDSQLPVPVGSSAQISFNGNRPGHNLYLLDGGENSDRGGAGASSVMPSIDAVSEIQTLTSNYSADYGLSSGGTISSAIKSGTKTLHASVWEFFRNDALDARNFFNTKPNPVAEFRYNIYGFNVGGPVTLGKFYNPNRTKTFFFYNMEWRKFIVGQTLNQHVPDPGTYGGSFGSTVINVPSAATTSAAVLGRNCPGGVLPAGIVQGAPFPGNTIPSCMLDPNAQALLHAGGKYGGIFPAPTSGTNFIGGNNVPTNVREEIVRMDHNINDKMTIYGHFVAEQISQGYGTTQWSGDNVPSISDTFGNPSYAGVVHMAYTINPNLVNEIAFNYNGNRINILPVGLFTAPSDFTFNRFFTGPNVDSRIPAINLNGSTGANYTSNWTPWINKADSYQIRDDISLTHGRHQFKFGGGWLLYKKVQDWFKDTEGQFQFNGNFTGNDFADFLLGLGQDYQEDAIKSAGNWNNVSWALYFQDNFRATNRLTLNLGMRWDGIPHTYEANKQMANFYPNLYNPANAAILNPDGNTISTSSPGLGPSSNPILAGQSFYVNGIAICGVGVPRGCVNDSWHNFQPRIGFAYDVTGRGKTVIRGGYGIMNERIQGNDVYNNAGTVPLAASIDFKNVLLSNPKMSTTGTLVPASIPVNNVTGMDRSNYQSPRSTQFSLGVQQSFGTSVLSLSYVGSQNRHQNYYTETDLAPLTSLPAFVSGTNTVPYNSVVQFPGYHSIKIAQNEANGDYNSFQASFRGNLKGNDLTYQLGYTYSHANDSFNNNSSAGDLYPLSDPYLGWKYDFGPSAYDHRQAFFANFVYEIPFMRHADNHFVRTAVGGWEVSGIVTATSGAPLNIFLNGQNVASIVPNSDNRPDQTGSSGHDPHTVAEWFDTSIYSKPAPGTWGNTPRNSVWGPGRDNWNISLFKNFVFSEQRGSSLQFRAEFFNVWNHTQFQGDTINNSGQNISTKLGAGDFGQIKSANDPRIIQLALKLYF